MLRMEFDSTLGQAEHLSFVAIMVILWYFSIDWVRAWSDTGHGSGCLTVAATKLSTRHAHIIRLSILCAFYLGTAT